MIIYIILAAIVAVLLIAVAILVGLHAQARKKLMSVETALIESEQNVQKARDELEEQVDERTIGVSKLNEQLNQQIADLGKESKKQKELIKELQELLEVKSSGDFLPICSNCKDIRDENGFWQPIEEFLQNLANSDFSHTLCPDCTKKLYPEMFEGGAKPFCLSWKPGQRKAPNEH